MSLLFRNYASIILFVKAYSDMLGVKCTCMYANRLVFYSSISCIRDCIVNLINECGIISLHTRLLFDELSVPIPLPKYISNILSLQYHICIEMLFCRAKLYLIPVG